MILRVYRPLFERRHVDLVSGFEHPKYGYMTSLSSQLSYVINIIFSLIVIHPYLFPISTFVILLISAV